MLSKKNILRTLHWAGKASGLVLGFASYQKYVPEEYAPVALLIFGAASFLKDTIKGAGDLVDDGKKNDSFKLNDED